MTIKLSIAYLASVLLHLLVIAIISSGQTLKTLAPTKLESLILRVTLAHIDSQVDLRLQHDDSPVVLHAASTATKDNDLIEEQALPEIGQNTFAFFAPEEPAKLLFMPRLDGPEMLSSLQAISLEILINVNALGWVEFVQIVSGPDIYYETLSERISGARFIPAKRGGVAVSSQVKMILEFPLVQ